MNTEKKFEIFGRKFIVFTYIGNPITHDSKDKLKACQFDKNETNLGKIYFSKDTTLNCRVG